MSASPIPSGFKFRQPDTIQSQRAKFMIFGAPGIGKTLTATDFPSAVLIDTEKGATQPHYVDKLRKSGAWYMGPEDGSTLIDVVTQQVEALATKAHDRKTLILDSISHLWNLTCAEKEKAVGNSYNRDRKEAMPHFRRLFSWIDRLDMNVIIIAHEREKYEKGVSVGQTYDGPDKWDYMLDLTGRVIRQGESRKLVIIKTRLKAFPDNAIIPWTYDEFASRYGRENLEATAQVVTLAKPDQIAAFNELTRILNTPRERIEKFLAAANADSIEELPATYLDKAIKTLRAEIGALSKEPNINITGKETK